MSIRLEGIIIPRIIPLTKVLEDTFANWDVYSDMDIIRN